MVSAARMIGIRAANGRPYEVRSYNAVGDDALIVPLQAVLVMLVIARRI